MFSFNADEIPKKQANVAEVTFVNNIDWVVKKSGQYSLKRCEGSKVNLDNQTIYIKYEPTRTDKEKLAAAIVKLGYTAEEKIVEEVKK